MSRFTVRRLALPLLAAAAAACGDHAGPTDFDTPQFAKGGSPGLDAIAEYAGGPPQITIAWARAWIGPAGGSVRLLDFEIVVPAGAVSKTTQFSIRVPVDPKQSAHAMAEFGPHNVTFARDVTIRLPLRGTTAEGSASPQVLWWNGAQWVEYAATTLDDGRIETTTNHFSIYGTEEPGRGITPLGG